MNDYVNADSMATIENVLDTFGLFFLIFSIFMIACFWRIFHKAGKPGWATLVPFYNVAVILQIVGKPSWWLLLLFVPGINIIIAVLMLIEMARSFGYGPGFGIGMFFLPIIFIPLLAIGENEYIGPGGKGKAEEADDAAMASSGA
jgi:hypothetical protein